ncbi:MAG: GNAT family N-acetyltransferase [Limosilactobacillus sp.]|uniref:GNAT family N-acetyltransferase n=1 Tax=Limosilactobacillus sp. TaxID=2773925 RepID=UPI00271069AF|nr:GNAT family N-acetyltransferase [Limosilactobacillus sp.]
MIKTKRLTISKITRDDGQVTALLSDPELLKPAHIRFYKGHATEFEVNIMLETATYLGVYLDTTLIGFIRYDEYSGEIGYVLARNQWGHGYITEALEGLIPTLHRDLKASTDIDNVRSQDVLRRLGFIETETLYDRKNWALPLARSGQ